MILKAANRTVGLRTEVLQRQANLKQDPAETIIIPARMEKCHFQLLIDTQRDYHKIRSDLEKNTVKCGKCIWTIMLVCRRWIVWNVPFT